MNIKNIHKPLLIVGATVIVVIVAFGLASRFGTPANANSIFSLQAPPFVSVARAQTDSIGSTIEDEAGISAYWQAPTSINLNDVRGAFRTIEVETPDYIIGSVPVPNYPETEDVHVYAHKDGWILAYYLAADPAGKIFDWRKYHDSDRADFTTKLESTIAVVASEAGIPFYYNATYYDFRYPNATHLMLIGEWVYGGYHGQTDFFDVKLPGNLTYYERSWSFGRWTSDTDCTTGTPTTIAWYQLDGTTIQSYTNSCPGLDWQTSQGTLTAAQLLPDQFHRIAVHAIGYYTNYDYYVYAYGGLALVYQVP